ncbi:MAG: c-type cytochrome [Pseudomonadota bacterium]|nr:c-type cytochrome [Pseudomonadota bacterium]
MSRGEYLARAGDCSSCHIDGPNKQLYVGGLALHSPLGTIYATNITPDPDTGIGRYTLEDFSRALRAGVAKDGHHLYPAMPYPSFAGLSDEDVKELYEYFMRHVAAVSYEPPKTALSFPFNQRWALAFWNLAFVPSGPFSARPEHDAAWNRGAYLVQTIGHCGACHTPRGYGFQEKAYSESSRDYLTGALEDHWFSADLSGDPASGLGAWDDEEIVRFLKTGYGHNALVFGNMGMVVANSLQFLAEADLLAIARYLKSLPASREHASYTQGMGADPHTEHPGQGLYVAFCAECHGRTGAGKLPRYPPLAGDAAVLSRDPTSLIRMVLEGGTAPSTATGTKPAGMPGFANKLSDREIGEVLSYVRNDWGNAAAPVSTRDVDRLRKLAAARTVK